MTSTPRSLLKPQSKFKVDLKDYKIVKEIDIGSRSSVFSVQNIKTKKKYAAKVIKNQDEGEIIKKMNNYSFNNIFICQHPTLARYYGYSPVDFKGNKNVTLILELMTDLPLSSFIDQAQNGISNVAYRKSRQIILLGIARGMMYLQKHHILLRNLNPSNIYLDEQHHPLIVNYGFSNNTKLSKLNPKDLSYQDAIYMAPEILANNHYNLKSNVYSFGIIMYEVLTGTIVYPLFESGKMSSTEFVQKIINEDLHPKFSTPLKRSFKKLIKRCLSKNAHDRPSFEEIFNMLAYNIEDAIFDTGDDNDSNDNDHNYYLDDTNNDEYFEYIDMITKNDIVSYTDPLNISVDELQRDNENLKKENEQLQDQISLLKKQNTQLAKNFEKTYSEHILPLETNLEQLKKDNDKMKKIISKLVNQRKESYLAISPVEETKVVDKQSLTQMTQEGTSWDDFDDSKDTSSEKNKDDKKKTEKSFSDSDDEVRGRRQRSSSLKGRRNSTKNAPLRRYSSKSDTEDNYEVMVPKTTTVIKRPSRISPRKGIKTTYVSDDDNDDEIITKNSRINEFHETNINLDRFNALPLRFQRSFVSEFITKTPDKFNQDLMLIKDLLNYLLLFHESINSIRYFTVSTNNPKESYKNVNEWCEDISEVHLLSAATKILYLNKALDSSEFISIIKQFKSISIEVKYPSENFTKIFRIISDIKNSYISHLQIAVSISGVATSDDTFRKNKDVTSIKLDSSVLYIGQNSFRDCSSLANISIPSSVQSIEYGAFRKCVALKQVIIPTSVTTIGEGSFSRCTDLQKVTVPNSVNQIDQWAFSACTSLREFVIPKSVTKITVSCFADCISLIRVVIPDSVTIIESRAFHKCTSLKNVSLPLSIVSIGEGAFSKCSSLTKIIIPLKVSVIRKTTFSECSSLEDVAIPPSVTTIEDQAFEGCFSLGEVSVPSSVTSLGFWAFPSNTVISSTDEK